MHSSSSPGSSAKPATRNARSARSPRSLRQSIDIGNRPSVTSSQWYLAEALGLLDREPEMAAVLHGYTTRGVVADLMPLVVGREADLHATAVEAIRTALGDERFAALTDRGMAMSYDEAADYTMAELERITQETATPG